MVDIVSPYQINLVECVVIPRLCSPAKSAFPVKLPLERISNAVVYSKSTLCNEQCCFLCFFFFNSLGGYCYSTLYGLFDGYSWAICRWINKPIVYFFYSIYFAFGDFIITFTRSDEQKKFLFRYDCCYNIALHFFLCLYFSLKIGWWWWFLCFCFWIASIQLNMVRWHHKTSELVVVVVVAFDGLFGWRQT